MTSSAGETWSSHHSHTFSIDNKTNINTDAPICPCYQTHQCRNTHRQNSCYRLEIISTYAPIQFVSSLSNEWNLPLQMVKRQQVKKKNLTWRSDGEQRSKCKSPNWRGNWRGLERRAAGRVDTHTSKGLLKHSFWTFKKAQSISSGQGSRFAQIASF